MVCASNICILNVAGGAEFLPVLVTFFQFNKLLRGLIIPAEDKLYVALEKLHAFPHAFYIARATVAGGARRCRATCIVGPGLLGGL